MIWLEFVLMTVVIIGSHGCLQCSKEAMALRNEFVHDYLEKKVQGDREFRQKLQTLLDNVIERLSNEPVHPKKYMGVIDEATLKKLTAFFKRSLNKIMENNFKDGQLFNELMWSLQKLVAYFQEIIPHFTKLYCSNECGRMVYIFISCSSCKNNLYSCNKNLKCGERRVTVEEDEDLILDCALTWHKSSHGLKKYQFFRTVDGKQQIMAVGAESFLTKKEASKRDEGRYRCQMVDPEGIVESELDFQVVVVPPKEKTASFTNPPELLESPPSVRIPALLTPPPAYLITALTLGISSRAPPPEADWMAWIVSGITGGLLFFIVVAFLCYYRRKAKEEEEEDDDDDDDDDEDDDDEEEDNYDSDHDSSD